MRIRPRRSFATAALVGALLTAAGLADAQQRASYFRFMSSFVAGSDTLTPPTETPTGPIDFGKPGSVQEYWIRTVVGEPYSLEMTTVNGVPAIRWLPAPSNLPPGFEYADGVIWGQATEPFHGVRSFLAQDSTDAQATGKVNFDIVDAAVSISRLKSVVRIGSSYDGDITSNVRGAVYTHTPLPGLGLTVPDDQSRSKLRGTATTPGSYQIVATVGRPGTPIHAVSSSQSVTVAPALALDFVPPQVSPVATAVNVEARPAGVVGTGSIDLVSPSAATLSARGLTYSQGRLTGTLSQGPETTLTLRLTDSGDGSSVTASLPIPGLTDQAAIEIGEMRPGTPPAGNIVTAVPDPVCTVTQAVPGINVTPDCKIEGSPSTPGSYVLGVSIVPRGNSSATPVRVSAAVVVHPSLVVGSPAAYNRAPGNPLNLSPSVTGVVGTGTYRLIGITAGQLLNVGLSFNPSTGTVSGYPDPDLNLEFEVEIIDSKDGAKGTANFIVVTAPAATTVDTATVNLRPARVVTRNAYSNIANAKFSLIGAPDFVAVDEASGRISYTGPTSSDIHPIQAFVVRAANAERPQIFRDATVAAPGMVRPTLSLSVPDVAGRIGQAITPVPVALVGASSPRFNVVGQGFMGLTLGTSQITGTPNKSGTVTSVVTVVDDADAETASDEVTVAIQGTLVATAPATTLYQGSLGQNLTSSAPSHSGAVGTVRWLITNSAGGGAPAGTGVNATTGVVSATSASSQDISINLVAEDVVSGAVAQTAIASTPIIFRFAGTDASTRRPTSAGSSANTMWFPSGTNTPPADAIARLYDGSMETGIRLNGGSNEAVNLIYSTATYVDCAIVESGSAMNMALQSFPNGVGGSIVTVGPSGGVFSISPGSTSLVRLVYPGAISNGTWAWVYGFKAGVRQGDGSCKTAP